MRSFREVDQCKRDLDLVNRRHALQKMTAEGGLIDGEDVDEAIAAKQEEATEKALIELLNPKAKQQEVLDLAGDVAYAHSNPLVLGSSEFEHRISEEKLLAFRKVRAARNARVLREAGIDIDKKPKLKAHVPVQTTMDGDPMKHLDDVKPDVKREGKKRAHPVANQPFVPNRKIKLDEGKGVEELLEDYEDDKMEGLEKLVAKAEFTFDDLYAVTNTSTTDELFGLVYEGDRGYQQQTWSRIIKAVRERRRKMDG